jgi:3D (Asp-Asp-Asp) domain-containing protein
MIIKSVVLGWILLTSPVPQPIPNLINLDVPKPKPMVFHVTESEYEKSQKEVTVTEHETSWKNGIATAYYNGKDRMNGETGITASGYNLDNGSHYMGYHILASDRNIPLGTLVDIKINDEVLHCVVLDRGGAIVGHHFDLVLNGLEECVQFGKKEIQWQIVGKISTQ